MYHSERNAGFTLIELLIVMVIMASAMAIVAPLTMQQVHSAQQRAEREQIRMFLQQVQYDAFFQQSTQLLWFEGRQILRGNDKVAAMQLDFVSFSNKTLTVFPSGAFSEPFVSAAVDEVTWHLELSDEKAVWSHAD